MKNRSEGFMITMVISLVVFISIFPPTGFAGLFSKNPPRTGAYKCLDAGKDSETSPICQNARNQIEAEKNITRKIFDRTKDCTETEVNLTEPFETLYPSQSDLKSGKEMGHFLSDHLRPESKKGSSGPLCLDKEVFTDLINAHLHLKPLNYSAYDTFQLYEIVNRSRAEWERQVAQNPAIISMTKKILIPKSDLSPRNKKGENLALKENVFEITITASGDLFVDSHESTFQLIKHRRAKTAFKAAIVKTAQEAGSSRSKKLGSGTFSVVRSSVHLSTRPSSSTHLSSPRSPIQPIADENHTPLSPLSVSAINEPNFSKLGEETSLEAMKSSVEIIDDFNSNFPAGGTPALAHLRVVHLAGDQFKITSDPYEMEGDKAWLLMKEPEQRKSFLNQAAKNLKVIHDVGWVHNDLKDLNLIAKGFNDSKTGEVAWIDMGLAFNRDRFIKRKGTQLLSGTPGYFPPESIFMPPKTVTSEEFKTFQKRDIFSFGMMIYYLYKGYKSAADNFRYNPHNFDVVRNISALQQHLRSKKNPLFDLVAEMVEDDADLRPTIETVVNRLSAIPPEQYQSKIMP